MKGQACFTQVNGVRRIVGIALLAVLGLAVGALFRTNAVKAAEAPQISTETKAPADEIYTRLVLLGTAGGPNVDVQRSGIASLLVVNGRPYLIDCGIGTLRQLKKVGFEPNDITRVFITHLHMDHTADLGALGAFNWASGRFRSMQVYGPPGTRKTVEGASAFYAEATDLFTAQLPPRPPMVQLIQGVDVDASSTPTLVYQDDLIRVLAVENSHYQTLSPELRNAKKWKSYSYRVETPDRVVVFSGDTGPSETLVALANGADILVSEALDLETTMTLVQSLYMVSRQELEPVAAHMRDEHLEGKQIGQIASAANVKMVVLSHVNADIDHITNKVPYIDRVKQYYTGPVILGSDLQEF